PALPEAFRDGAEPSRQAEVTENLAVPARSGTGPSRNARCRVCRQASHVIPAVHCGGARDPSACRGIAPDRPHTQPPGSARVLSRRLRFVAMSARTVRGRTQGMPMELIDQSPILVDRVYERLRQAIALAELAP